MFAPRSKRLWASSRRFWRARGERPWRWSSPALCPWRRNTKAIGRWRARWRPWLLPLGGLVQFCLASYALTLELPQFSALNGWLELDPVGRLFLGFVSLFFFLCSLYAPAYLDLRAGRPNRIICSCMFLSLAMMTLVILSHHMGLMWVAMEATTLFTAPSLYFNHNARSLEATWKFLVICS